MTTIRPMQPADKEAVLAMMEVFYASPAVLSNGSAAIFSSDFEACINNNPYLEGYMFEENGQIQGSLFLEFIEKKYPEAVLRLEVEEENGRAVKVYEKNGFNVLPYMEMKKLL